MVFFRRVSRRRWRSRSSLKLNSPSQLQPIERVLLLWYSREREGLRGALKAQHGQPSGQQRRRGAHMRRHPPPPPSAWSVLWARSWGAREATAPRHSGEVGLGGVGEGCHSLAQLEAVGPS